MSQQEHEQELDNGSESGGSEADTINEKDDEENNNNNNNNEEKDDDDKDKKNDELSAGEQSQLSLKSTGLQKRRSTLLEEEENMQKMLQNMQSKAQNNSQLTSELDEFEEIQVTLNDKGFFEELFLKIDPEDNGDVDKKEWVKGLKRIGVDLTKEDMIKIFRLLDQDKLGYVDRKDWVTFCTTTFENSELTRLQDSILLKVKGHSRKPTNLLKIDDEEKWDLKEVTNMQREMTEAAAKLANEYSQKINQEQEFYEHIEKRASEIPDFGKYDRASEWIPEEVAWWLDQIDLGQYARVFNDEKIDGSILLNDTTQKLLEYEMKIKPVHVGKLLREIDVLRKANANELDQPYRDWNELSEENEMLHKKIKELEDKNASLHLELSHYTEHNNDIPTVVGANIEHQTKKKTKTNSQQETNYNNEKKDSNGNNNNDNDDDDDFENSSEMAKILREEVEILQKSKIELAISTAEEITRLRKIIHVLNGEYEMLRTPKWGNPVDLMFGALGYEKK